jgi:predicted nucleic acid-binding Zn finger protein
MFRGAGRAAKKELIAGSAGPRGTGAVLSRTGQGTDVSEGGDDFENDGTGASGPSRSGGDSERDGRRPSREEASTTGEPSIEADSEGGGYAVPTEAATDRETDWRAELEDAGRLTPSAVDALVTLHGSRGQRAIEAVSESRVKRYRDFTVVVGYEDEYLVEDGGCTCKDSSYNLDHKDPNQRCWHVLGVAVAERIGEVDYHDMWYSDVREFL